MAASNQLSRHEIMLPLTPTKLGRYEIVDEIGKGAMGIVYLARDPLIGRLVALKTFRIGYSVKDQEMEQFRIRFMREAQSAGILTHPNIVTIHDVVEASEEGLAFIAMEYVRGTNLKLMLQGDQPLTFASVLDVVSQVGDALDYAHANRVVHRDVKPANILITQEGRVKITDFGIARLDSSNLTQEGQLLGTPNYMAPEQIQGKEVDHRADLFSLGVVLYEMLTRHKPFQGENLTVVSHRIVYDQFTPLREYAHDLPPGVDRILNRALEKDPGRRYQRAKEMVEDLRQAVAAASPRGDDLNETMALPPLAMPPPAAPPPAAPAPAARGSFLDRLRGRPAAAPAPAPPPPPAVDATAGTGTDTGGTGSTGSGASLSATPLPASPAADPLADPLVDTVATEAPALSPPPAPAARRSGISPRRLVAAGLIAVLAVLALWGGSLLLTRRLYPDGPQRNAEEDTHRARVLELVREGRQAGESGNWATAVFYFREAERLDPKSRRIHGLRMAAEKKVSAQYSQDAGRANVIAMGLANANQALAAQSWDAALVAARTVLELDHENAEAQSIVLKAQEGQARRARQQRRAQTPSQPAPGEVATAAPITSEQPVHPAAPAPAATNAPATLHIHVSADMEGSVIVSVVGRQELLRHTFERGGLFSRNKSQSLDDINQTKEVPAGAGTLRIIIAPKGHKGEVKIRDMNFQGGSSHRLEIHLLSSAEATIQLN
jgi:tRNA A-37 threonylcarbamoyl transferase component Bud32